MEKWIKKFVFIVTVIVCMTLVVIPVSAKPSVKKVKKAYSKYLSKNIWGKDKYTHFGETKDIIADLNGDSVYELIITYTNGVRSGVEVYTYKNNKVVKLSPKKGFSGIGGVYAVKKGRQLYLTLSWSNGYRDSGYDVYKMTGTKLKRVSRYRMSSSKLYGRNTIDLIER